MKRSIEMLQNLPWYFWNKTSHVDFVDFCKCLFVISKKCHFIKHNISEKFCGNNFCSLIVLAQTVNGFFVSLFYANKTFIVFQKLQLLFALFSFIFNSRQKQHNYNIIIIHSVKYSFTFISLSIYVIFFFLLCFKKINKC